LVKDKNFCNCKSLAYFSQKFDQVMRYLLILSVIFSSCSAVSTTQSVESNNQTELSKQLVGGVLWYQKSAEMRLAYYQAYHYAKVLLDGKLETSKNIKPPAVVLDIDETVLDNSPYEVYLIDNGETYRSETWFKWTDQARAEALPGALDFVNYAKSRGVEVFYISNRLTRELEVTIENLKKEKFPNAEEKFIMLKETTSDKTERRAIVSNDYNVIVYIGDNLTDYLEDYGDRGDDMGLPLVDKNKDRLLSEFVMLPNPMYGEWEKAIYDNNYRLTDEEKLKKREEALKR
jgi:5'-nucleotidase (lipoprotein e(P4) family)